MTFSTLDSLGRFDPTLAPVVRRNLARVVVYDIEVLRAPRPLVMRGVTPETEKEIEYCDGWDDHANMGISVIGAIDLETGLPRVFLGDNLDTFAEWVGDRPLAGYNSRRFDDRVCAANGAEVRTSLDVLQWIWASMGLDPEN